MLQSELGVYLLVQPARAADSCTSSSADCSGSWGWSFQRTATLLPRRTLFSWSWHEGLNWGCAHRGQLFYFLLIWLCSSHLTLTFLLHAHVVSWRELYYWFADGMAILGVDSFHDVTNAPSEFSVGLLTKWRFFRRFFRPCFRPCFLLSSGHFLYPAFRRCAMFSATVRGNTLFMMMYLVFDKIAHRENVFNESLASCNLICLTHNTCLLPFHRFSDL